MLFSFLYELAIACAFVLNSPRMLYQLIRHKKYRTNLFARFGFGFPTITPKKDGPVIWIHAVSVGEIHAIAGLAKQLKEEINNLTLVISSTTETGHAEAKKTLAWAADAFVYLPFDFWLCVKKVLSRCTPDIVILSEGDLWYRFLHEVKKKGAITLITNGKMSKRSAEKMARFSYFGKKLVSLIDHFCLQSELYKQRFILTGVPASKISITGNSKADALPLPLEGSAIDELKQKLGVKTN
ncbi:MAG: 3-deoxy-D-manno-octulosonic acid transferase, partial [Verrucomicrobia bacterium]|nr:3-deoxy-D-manno-octulosonic acid transferase [Verrucomicrobiota bacterium]